MYKYIFTHTHTLDLKLVEDTSAKLQQKWYWYDSDEDSKNIKTLQWHRLWIFPSREQVLLKLFHLPRLAANMALNSSFLEWLKKTKHDYPQNSCLQTQVLLVQLTAHLLMHNETGLWLKGSKNTVHWHDPRRNSCPPCSPQPCQVQDSSPSSVPAAPWWLVCIIPS